jgi:murein DD-endopeptidase MepM/ murein hydrolase activator NlpD
MYLHSPTKCTILRDKDNTGNGWFGAKRGTRLHKGVDYVVVPGEPIFACCAGVVRIGNVYWTSTKMKLVEISGAIDVHDVRVKQMYVLPCVKTGETVQKGQLIGVAQDVAKYHGSKEMKPHVHISVWKNGLLTDPEPIIIGN